MAYGYYRSITIDHTKCGSGASSSFPVLVSISGATSVKTVANGGKVNNTGTQVGGVGGTIPFDLVFSSDTAGASKYPWEIESYDGTAGTLIAWVQVPTMPTTGGADITFYMAYGDAAVNTQQNTSTFAPSAVWDTNYKGVWHLPNGSSLSAIDSTGVNNGTITSATAGTGQVDGAGVFSGSSQYISIADAASLRITGAITIELWVKPTDKSQFMGLIGKTGTGTANATPAPYDFYLANTTGKPRFLKGSGGGGASPVQGTNYQSLDATTAPTSGVWSHLAVTMTGSNSGTWTHYLNGAANGTGTPSFTDASTDGAGGAKIATRNDLFTMFKGSMDEIRISNSARTVDWVLTSYNNQNAPGNIGSAGFLTFGGETSPTTGGPFPFFTSRSGGFNPMAGGLY